MDDIIKKLNAIESNANEIIDNAILAKKENESRLNSILEDIDYEFETKARSKLDELEKSKESMLEVAKQNLKSNYESKTLALESDFKLNKETYINNIFNNIIKD